MTAAWSKQASKRVDLLSDKMKHELRGKKTVSLEERIFNYVKVE
jgi:hypothetical protein